MAVELSNNNIFVPFPLPFVTSRYQQISCAYYPIIQQFQVACLISLWAGQEEKSRALAELAPEFFQVLSDVLQLFQHGLVAGRWHQARRQWLAVCYPLRRATVITLYRISPGYLCT